MAKARHDANTPLAIQARLAKFTAATDPATANDARRDTIAHLVKKHFRLDMFGPEPVDFSAIERRHAECDVNYRAAMISAMTDVLERKKYILELAARGSKGSAILAAVPAFSVAASANDDDPLKSLKENIQSALEAIALKGADVSALQERFDLAQGLELGKETLPQLVHRINYLNEVSACTAAGANMTLAEVKLAYIGILLLPDVAPECGLTERTVLSGQISGLVPVVRSELQRIAETPKLHLEMVS